jgi:oligoendopeptidase F
MQVIQTALAKRWIDVFPRKAKYSGGFNTGVYTVHPFILLNYQNTLRDVEVVAHELGHAAHSYFSSKNQPYIYSNYTIFVAEIASITNEIILYKYLLAHEKDTTRRREMLYQFLNGINATFYRQAMFAEFEDNAHTLASEGKSINAESLAKIWMDIQQKYYGDTIELDELSSIYWAYIPHFFSSDFYVYQYATSLCAAVVIGERIYNGDKELLSKYLSFLKQGSRKNSVELIKDLGIDLSKPEPIIQAIHAFEKLLNEYEAMMGSEKSS